MISSLSQHRESGAARHGYTMLELLIVVAVISVLMSLIFFVMNGMVDNAEQQATKATLLKVSQLYEQRLESFERAFKGARRNSYIQGTVGLLTMIDGRFDYFLRHPEEAPPAIIMLAKKAAYRFEFPQRMDELTGGTPDANGNGNPDGDDNGDGIPDSIYLRLLLPNSRQQLIDGGNPSPTPAEVDAQITANWAKHMSLEAAAQVTPDVLSTESSELLYYFLTQSGSFGASPVDAAQFSEREVADTDEDGLMEFVDAWGRPLQFYRWPTRLIDPTAPSPFVPDFSDPNDPTETRSVTGYEREYAKLLMKGIPDVPKPIGGVTQRDVLLVDPDDPVGILYTFIEDPKYRDMGINLTLEYNEEKYHTPDTYHSPLVVSAGKDGLTGLRRPNETNGVDGIYGNLAQYWGTTAFVRIPDLPGPQPSADVLDQLLDNVSNRNRRAGGQ